MRRVFLRLEVLAVLVVAACLTVLSMSSEAPATPDLELTAGPGDTLTLSNSKEGAAILSLGDMRPGDSVTDTVTLGNTGTIPGDLSLATSNLVDTPGSGGGALSGELDLRIRDVTVPGSPVTVYEDKIDAVTPVALGTLAAGDSRVYEFRVSFPDAGPGAEDVFQGSSTSVQFDWTAVDTGPDLIPPETTITSGPASLTSSPDATFAFTADETGSTFECSLDSGGFVACTSPQSYSGLADGAHTFDVRATDTSANTDSTPDTDSWTVDATAPTVSLADPGSPVHGTVALTPSADDGSGSGVATLVVQRSPAGAGTWTTIGTSWNTASVADGTYDQRARATDNAGNAANSALRTVTVDNGLPSKPKKFSGAKTNGHLVLKWKASTDAGGPISAYLVYANGSLVKTLGGSARSVDMGRFKTSDARVFQVAAQDAVVNIGPKTHGLVIVPALERLSVAKAKKRLQARGLRLGAVTYAYSNTVASGLVIHAGSQVAAQSAAVRVTVSRGRKMARPPTATDGSNSSYGYTPPPGSETTTPGGTVAGGNGFSSTPMPIEPAGGNDTAGSSADAVETDDVVPSSYSRPDNSSPLRRPFGLALLGGAFLAAGTAAVRASRPLRATRTASGLEPIVFWDERLLHAVSSALRRVTGRI